MAGSKSDEKRTCNRKDSGFGHPSQSVFGFVFVLLCILDLAHGQLGEPTVYTPFRCSEVQLLKDEDLTVKRPHCEFLVGSLNSATYSLSRYGEIKHKFPTTAFSTTAQDLKACVDSALTSKTEEIWMLTFEERGMIHLKEFLSAKCSNISDVLKSCGENFESSFQLTETYHFSLHGGSCPINISIVSDNTFEGCNFEGEYSLCTAERKTASQDEELNLPNCSVNYGTYNVSIDVLFRHPVTLEPTRKTVPYNGVALKVSNYTAKFKQRSLFCDLLTIETLNLVPELVNYDLRVLVLLSFNLLDKEQEWTLTTRIRAIRLLRDQHELHMQSCNLTDDTNPLTFHYLNVTNFTKKAGYMDVPDPNYIDYYALNFWKVGSYLRDRENQVENIVNSNGNTIQVGGEMREWKNQACQILLDHLRAEPNKPGTDVPYRVEELVLVLQFNISTALSKRATRTWTVSVMFAYMVDIHPSPYEQVKCSPETSQSKTAQLRVPISEKYYSLYKRKDHFWNTCADRQCHYHVVESNGERHSVDAEYYAEQINGYMPVKTPLERANGPQNQFYILLKLDTSRICNYATWLEKLDLHNNLSYASYLISYDLTRSSNGYGIFISSPVFWTEIRIKQAFIRDEQFHEFNCKYYEYCDYWQEKSSINITSVGISKLNFSYTPLYSWKIGAISKQSKEVDKVAGENYHSYFTPSDSIQLKIVRQQLCKLLEVLPVRALGLDYVPSNNTIANLSLEYEATSYFCKTLDSSCSNETARIRLQVVQTNFRPWVFYSVNCAHNYGNSSSMQKLAFRFEEVYNRKLENVSFGRIEYHACSKLIHYSGFNRFFLSVQCKDLTLNFSNLFRWQHKVSKNFRNLTFSISFAQICKTLTEAEGRFSEVLEDQKLFIKAPFGLQSEEHDRALLIMIDYEVSAQQLLENQPLKTKIKELSHLLNTEDDSREQLQLLTKEQQTSVTSRTDFVNNTKVMSVSFLWLIFMFVLLVILHRAYVALVWRCDASEWRMISVNNYSQLAGAAQLNEFPCAVVPEEYEDNFMLDSVLTYDHNQNLYRAMIDTDPFPKLESKLKSKSNTLPCMRHVSFSFDYSKIASSKLIDEKVKEVWSEELTLNASAVRSESVSPDTLHVAGVSSQEQCEEENGHYCLE